MTAPASGVLDKLQRRTLMKILEQAPDRLEDLDITITRTDSMAPERLGSSGHTVRVVPFNQSASDVRIAFEKALRVYALRVAIVVGEKAPETPAAKSQFLFRHLPSIADDAPSIEGIYSAIVGAADKARRAIDSPLERVYVGHCNKCDRGLYAIKDSETTSCRTCGTKYSVDESREDILAAAKDYVATPYQLEKFLPHFAGRPIKASAIRKWAERGKITGIRSGGETMYRIGDVIALHKASAVAEAA
ncbi:hypothetical protein [Rhodococcoides fascians]|uniref:hypothetical protein n=1 Tax=Rhodococcoides fascians TaxID=1828 RepID=UPI00050C5A15|nr:hypothetical protein [Rhodococcus fascians]